MSFGTEEPGTMSLSREECGRRHSRSVSHIANPAAQSAATWGRQWQGAAQNEAWWDGRGGGNAGARAPVRGSS